MTVTHRSLSIASESGTFGSLGSDGIPSASGLLFISIPCERDPIVIAGEPVISERNDARDGPYFVPPEIDTVYNNSGERIRRRTGQVVCRVDLTTIGTAADTYAANYLGLLLGAGFLTQLPSILTGNVTAVDANTFTPASAFAEADIGTLISSSISGRAEYSAITNHNLSAGGNVTVSPALSTTSYTAARGLQTWYTPSRGTSGTYADSVAFRIDANAVGPIEPAYNTGNAPFFRGAYAVLSAGSPASLTNSTVGETQGRIAVDAEDFSCTITNTLTPLGHSNSILAMSNMEITDVAVEMSLTLSTVNTAIKDDFFNRAVRQVLIGTGPVGDGLGCAIMVPAAQLTVDPNVYGVSGDIVQQTLTYQQSRYAGDYSGDDNATYEDNAGCSPFRLGLGL
jgi:hypothetical protein